jgi:hypothetical protein
MEVCQIRWFEPGICYNSLCVGCDGILVRVAWAAVHDYQRGNRVHQCALSCVLTWRWTCGLICLYM